MSDNTRKEEVTVVGAGPVGSVLATFLGRHGIHVRLHDGDRDRREEEVDRRRSINLTLTHRGMEALKDIGLGAKVLEKAIPLYGWKIHPFNGDPYDIPFCNGGRLFSIDRHTLAKLLLDNAENTPNVTVKFESSLIFHKESNKLTLDGEDIETDFIFGCDGANSTIRKFMEENLKPKELNYQPEPIAECYKTIIMPHTEDGNFAMEENFFHIWSCPDFMMIGQPNQDKSFTLNIFMPKSKFESMKESNEENKEKVRQLFRDNFPETYEKIGWKCLDYAFFVNPYIGSIKPHKFSSHYMAEKNMLILGDAAYKCYPPSGQSGLEDSLIFNECLVKSGGDLSSAAKMYQDTHVRDTHALFDLSKKKYIEMFSHDTFPKFFQIIKFENLLHEHFPRFVPLYHMVDFTRTPYHQVVETHARQEIVIRPALLGVLMGLFE